MTTPRVSRDDLTAAVALVLTAAGAEPDIAAEVADNLSEADLVGRTSHGARLIPGYVHRLKAGEVNGHARPRLASEDGAILRVLGQNAFGQVVGAFSAREGVRAAKKHGIAAVAVTGSSHLGRNGKWAEIAAEAGVASLHFINSPLAPSSITPHGGAQSRLTSNPVAFGVPHPDGDHFIADFGVGAVSVNTIKQAVENGERLAQACILDAQGEITDDPAAFLAGNRRLLGFGGHKGFAIAVLAEMMAGLVAGGRPHLGDSGAAAVNNLFSIYIDVARLDDEGAYDDRMRALTSWIVSSPPLDEAAPVALPGQRGRAVRGRHERDGIPVSRGLAKALVSAARAAGTETEFAARWPALAQAG
ncbi:MAG: Ldh family oxidoreductase [Salinarimonadaceae bacterium]|nr:MAG: Ldh family oxidoreductase [Salinarimonadaceae bacterium]